MRFLRRTAIETYLRIGGGVVVATALMAGVLALSVQTVEAHNVGASGSYDCDGGWTYSANYLNGGGGGASDNRLLIIDVNIGGDLVKVIKEYHYFDTLTTHPSPPLGFIMIDNPTTTSFELFSVSGATNPISVTGSIRMYSAGSSLSPSSDPAYPHFLVGNSQSQMPSVASASGCPTTTSTVTATATATATTTSAPPTATPPPTTTFEPPTPTTATPPPPTATFEPPTDTPVPPAELAPTNTPTTTTPSAQLTGNGANSSGETAPTSPLTLASGVLGVVVEPGQALVLPATGHDRVDESASHFVALLLLSGAACGLVLVGLTIRVRTR